MAPIEIPGPVRRFLFEHIPTVERLEVLLLLFETKDRAWSIEEIEERIRSTPDSIRLNVSALVQTHLVRVDDALPTLFRYNPSDMDPTVGELAVIYRTRRVAVIEFIYADRRDSIRSFSNAFKFGTPHDG